METPNQPIPQTQTVQGSQENQTRRSKKIHCKQELIVNSLQRFYAGREDIDTIFEMLQGTSEISLRVIDWFVTNYSKTHSTSYILNGSAFLVYRDYKSQLKAYSKKLFDPFCRRERIYFQLPNRPAFLTTVAKLNFFRWALEKDIFSYIKEHQEEIEKEMNASMKELAKVRSSGTGSSTSSTDTTTTVSTVATVATVETVTQRSTTRRRVNNKDSAPIKLMQKHEFNTEMSFS